jgi:hypothetical protein
MYKASAVRSIGGFNSNFLLGEDIDLCLRLSEYGDIACLNESLIKHRRHSTNISKSVDGTGYSIFEYSVAATVCHLLRQHKIIDPSLAVDASLWRVFMQHISDFTNASGEHKYLKWKQILHNKKGGIILMLLLLKPNYTFRLINDRLWGSGFSEKCLRAWLKVQR